MKILKSNQNTKQLYDTDDVNIVKHLPHSYNSSNYKTPLHHSHNLSDKIWLLKYFPAEHPIFQDFMNSYYYV